VGLTPGDAYEYQVSGADAGGTVWSTLRTLSVPQAESGRTHLVRWLPPEDEDVAGYRVHLAVGSLAYGSGFDIGFIPAGSEGVAELELADLEPDLPYSVAMTAYDEVGNRSELSNAISFGTCPLGSRCAAPGNPLARGTAACEGALSAPARVRELLTDDSATALTVVWDAPYHPAGASLRYGPAGSAQAFQTVPAELLSVEGCRATVVARVEHLEPLTFYAYQVSAAASGAPVWSEPRSYRTEDLGSALCAREPRDFESGERADLPAGRLVSWTGQTNSVSGRLRYRRVNGDAASSAWTTVVAHRVDRVGCVARYAAILPELTPGGLYQYEVSFKRDGQVDWLGPRHLPIPAAPEPVPCDAAEIYLEEVTSGTAAGSPTVSTAADLRAVAGELYLAAVSSKPFEAVLDVTGLGLVWSPVTSRCSGRSQTGISVWMAQGAPSGDGPVSARLAEAPLNAAIAVSRYSGASSSSSLGSVATANTNGPDGACSGGSDDAAYSVPLPVSEGAVAYAAVAMRNRSHTPGAGFAERLEVMAGSAGDAAAVALQDRSVDAPGSAAVEGALSGRTDWAAVALEIRPAAPAGQCTGDGLAAAEALFEPESQPAPPPAPALASAVGVTAGPSGEVAIVDRQGGLVELLHHGFAAGREIRPAWCDLEGDDEPDLVLGFGPGSQGTLLIVDVRAGSSVGARLIQVEFPAYSALNGETFPACGDLDADGRDEIVCGLGTHANGWLALFDDATRGFRPYPATPDVSGFIQWTTDATYRSRDGSSRPAVGDFDGDGRQEIAVGLGDGGEGRLRILDDEQNGFAPLPGTNLGDGWHRWSTSPSYDAADGSSRPAAGDLDGDGRDEIVVGLGPDGGGRLFVIDDADTSPPLAPFSGVPDEDGWVRSAGAGETVPALADVDGDGRAEIAYGFRADDAHRLRLLELRDQVIQASRDTQLSGGFVELEPGAVVEPALR
jgi:hypothetical protein